MVLSEHLPRPGIRTPDLPSLSLKVLSIRPPRWSFILGYKLVTRYWHHARRLNGWLAGDQLMFPLVTRNFFPKSWLIILQFVINLGIYKRRSISTSWRIFLIMPINAFRADFIQKYRVIGSYWFGLMVNDHQTKSTMTIGHCWHSIVAAYFLSF